MADIRSTVHVLVLLRPVAEMTPTVGALVTAWFVTHGIRPERVAVGRPVERDPDLSTVHWREVDDEGRVVLRWRFSPDLDWPLPFPTVADEPTGRASP